MHTTKNVNDPIDTPFLDVEDWTKEAEDAGFLHGSQKEMASREELPQILIPKNEGDLGRKYLLDPDSPAEACYEAAAKILGHSSHAIDAWEPETVFAELHREGYDIPAISENKIAAMMALKANAHEPLTSCNTLQNIAHVFNNDEPIVDAHEKLEIEALAWGVEALRLFLKETPIYFDYEPIQYGAALLFEDGYFIAPPELEFLQGELSKRNRNTEFEEDIKKALEDPKAFTGNIIVQAQLEKLDRVKKYVSMMREAHAAAMSEVLGKAK